MPENPPQGYPRLTPYILYEDAGAAIAWLSRTFGFVERTEETLRNPEGKIFHSAMSVEGDSLILLGTPPNYESPHRHGRVYSQFYIYVDDVDAHYAFVKGAGARILGEPEDTHYGDRRYHVEDLEGHQWWFATHIRDVPPGGGNP